MIKLDSELSLQILKLSKKFASQHSKHADLYGGFEDYVSELNCSILKNLKSYNENKGAFSTWCYAVFETKIIRDIIKSIKRENIYEVKSLDQDINENGDSLIDIISDSINYKEDIERRLFAKELVRKILPYVSRDFLKYAIQDKSIMELAKEKEVSKQNMFNRIKRERIKLQSALQNNDFSSLKIKGECEYGYTNEIYY